MAWNDPNEAPLDVGDILTSSTMKDYVRDNLLALKNPPTDSAILDGSNYTSSNASFQDVDATNLNLTLLTNGGDILVHFHGMVHLNSTGSVLFNLMVDGNHIAADDGIQGYRSNNLYFHVPLSFTRLITGLAAGSHEIKLRWKVTNGATATLYAGAGTAELDVHPQFWAREVS